MQSQGEQPAAAMRYAVPHGKGSRPTGFTVRAAALIPLFLMLWGGASASAAPSLPGAAPTQSPPAVSAYADLELRWSGGVLTLERLTHGRFSSPVQLRRYVGRFEAEVRGRDGAVLETLRFDLPLLGEADAGVEEKLAETMRAKLTTVGVVRVPLPQGAETLRIRDRHARSGAPPALEVPLSGAARPSAQQAARTAETPQAAEPQPAKETAGQQKPQAPRRAGAAPPPRK
jgi:hypothetical protein